MTVRNQYSENSASITGSLDTQIRMKTMASTSQESLAELLCIFENASVGIVFERSGTIVRLNRAVERLLGYRRKEVEGLQSNEFRKKIFAGGSDQLLDASKQTFYLKRKDGERLWVTIKTKTFAQEDGLLATVWTMEDVSRLRDAEVRLRQMSLAVDQSSNAVVITDTLGTIVYVNSTFSKITGYSSSEVIGKKPSILKSGRTPPHIYSEMWDAITRGKKWRGHLINKKKNQETYEEEITVVPLKNEGGNITHFIAAKEDISELKKAREEAEKMSKAKGDLLACISHEVRTPLNVIIGMSDLVLESGLGWEQSNFLKRIKSSATNLLCLVNNLLDHSKTEAGKLIIEKKPFSLARLLDSIDNNLSFLAEKKGIAFSIQRNTVPDLFIGDQLRLHQVLCNLGDNAIKFTREGKVELLTEIQEQSVGQYLVTFRVKDSGIGIQQDRIKNIFDSFVQAETATARHFGGTGLGLAICNQLVQLMGGSLTVQSIPGLGSTFSFSILLPQAPAEKQQHLEGAQEERLSCGSLNVLLVEDDRGNQELASAILRSAGHTVTVAEHGLEALEILGNGKSFDVVLMDVQMPVLDGLATTRCIRKLEKNGMKESHKYSPIEEKLAEHLHGKHLYIVAMTANTMLSDKERYRDAGIDNFLGKPYNKTTLLAVLENSPTGNHEGGGAEARIFSRPSRHSKGRLYEKCRQHLLTNFALDEESSKNVLIAFLDALQENLEQLNGAIVEENRNDIGLHAHKMKGSLYNIDLEELAELSGKIEENAHRYTLVELRSIAAHIARGLSPLLRQDQEYTERKRQHDTAVQPGSNDQI
ncbi:MAG: hypothetical protein CSB23_00235 [Deltaproteobacteria bacterium]|nr:MAG: hypothetical protein CSB23_00235 [Deltaproteobacteria bacterium]